MFTVMTIRVSRQQLYIFGDLTSHEVYELKQEGWRVEWRERPVQRNKQGIPVFSKGAS
ncbi:hypothetical protein [Sporosarcina sp. Te-1]|uniref:hypothetical protein n=1 Tax=Sporosarcina sp. Te-1 TaxID=2818390 RepID=UPI001A9DEB79|nr:hypothetical protein [Sporosarcina sp. Te-1]QTD40602.1 hypothetical protein J3U78_17830 [Sporosarcina sp. Te-1]